MSLRVKPRPWRPWEAVAAKVDPGLGEAPPQGTVIKTSGGRRQPKANGQGL